MTDCFGFYSTDFGVDICSILTKKFLERYFKKLEENSKKKWVIFIRSVLLAIGIALDIIIGVFYL